MRRTLAAVAALACVCARVRAQQCQFWFPDDGVEFDLSSLQAMGPTKFRAAGASVYMYTFCQNITGVTCPPDNSQVVSMMMGPGEAGCLLPLGTLPDPQASMYSGVAGTGLVLTYSGGQACSQFGNLPTTTFTLVCSAGPTLVSDFQIVQPDCQIAYTIKTPAGCSYKKTRTITPLGAGWIAFSIILSIILLYLVGGAAYKRYRYGASGIEAIPNIDMWRACGRGVGSLCTCGRKPAHTTIDDSYYYDVAE